jgi:ferredoxin--NADP+ reductase
MVDGTGMCGGCRVLTNAGAKFACVDGPEFDAHQVDFDVLVRRNRTYVKDEADSLRRFMEHPEGELEKVRESCRLEQRHPEARCEASRS